MTLNRDEVINNEFYINLKKVIIIYIFMHEMNSIIKSYTAYKKSFNGLFIFYNNDVHLRVVVNLFFRCTKLCGRSKLRFKERRNDQIIRDI